MRQRKRLRSLLPCRPAYPSPGYPITWGTGSIQPRPIKNTKAVLVLTGQEPCFRSAVELPLNFSFFFPWKKAEKARGGMGLTSKGLSRKSVDAF